MPMMRLCVSLCRCLLLNAAREGEPVLGKGTFPSSVWPRCQKCLQVRWKIKDESPQRVWSLSDQTWNLEEQLKRGIFISWVSRDQEQRSEIRPETRSGPKIPAAGYLEGEGFFGFKDIDSDFGCCCEQFWNFVRTTQFGTLLVNDIPLVHNYSTRCRQLYVGGNF